MSEKIQLDPQQVKNGDLMCFLYWGQVDRCFSSATETCVSVTGIDGNKFDVRGNSLIRTAQSADQYHKVVRVTKTELAEVLISSHNKPFTVVFVKANGEERKMRGRLVRPEPLMGRSYVEDMDVKGLRQVDHRNIKSLIVDGIKYVLK